MIHAFLDYRRDNELHIIQGHQYWSQPFTVAAEVAFLICSGEDVQMGRGFRFMNSLLWNLGGIAMVTGQCRITGSP